MLKVANTVELLAQILETIDNCSPDFDDTSVDDMYDVLEIPYKDRTDFGTATQYYEYSKNINILLDWDAQDFKNLTGYGRAADKAVKKAFILGLEYVLSNPKKKFVLTPRKNTTNFKFFTEFYDESPDVESLRKAMYVPGMSGTMFETSLGFVIRFCTEGHEKMFQSYLDWRNSK